MDNHTFTLDYVVTSDWANRPEYADLRTRLATLKATHDKTPSGQYAKEQRTLARRLCTDAGISPMDLELIAPWAALRPTGWRGKEAENDRAWGVIQEKQRQEEAHRKAMQDFSEEEEAFRMNVETELQQWHQEHGAAFMDYLNQEPCFMTLVVWDALRRVAVALSESEPLTKYHTTHPLPCPLPPACGRAAFLASLPPGTPDHGKTYPGAGYTGGYQVLQDDLTI